MKKSQTLLKMMLASTLLLGWTEVLFSQQAMLAKEEEAAAVKALQAGEYSYISKYDANAAVKWGIEAKYRTKPIMDALLVLVKDPSRLYDLGKMDDEGFAIDELLEIATDSRDARFVPYLLKDGAPAVCLGVVTRMPQAAYEYAIQDANFNPTIMQYLLETPGGVAAEQRKAMRAALLKHLRGNVGKGTAAILKALGSFTKENDREVIDILKKYADQSWGTDIVRASVGSLGVGAQMGNSELIDYLKWTIETSSSTDAIEIALTHLVAAACYDNQVELLGYVERAILNNAQNPNRVVMPIVKLENLVLRENSTQAEILLQKLSQAGMAIANSHLDLVLKSKKKMP